MVRITSEVRDYLERLKLGFVATVSLDNTPNVSPKGTIIAWDDEHLVFADIRSPQTVRNLEANPAVEINIVDPLSRRGYRFKGTASILKEGEEFEKIIAHYKKNGIKSQIQAIVKVHVRSVRDVTSPLYDLGLDENQIRDKWKKIYADF